MVNRQSHGFSLMELLVVLVIITLLASLAAPVVTSSIVRSKEAALRENLLIMRKALDDYYTDKAVYPDNQALLVEDRYLRFIPADPTTGEYEWDWIYSSDEFTSGISDVKSLSTQQSLVGDYYNEW